MKDSILKGAGNSRFLKSAVPAGTSWADALAMLQAGTFPIDFNGINAEGFQQVGTPLNKANLLKDATAAQIGLPPSTTPDGMFQALGNTGELHVWRKTVVSSSEQPAGYTLGDVITNSEIWVENRYEDAVFHYATSISVSDAGLVSLVGEKTATIGHSNNGENIAEFDVFKGKFVYISGGDNNKRQFIFYIPANATFHRDGNYSTNKIYADKEQRVNAHGIIPPGTTSTYPVSTNPNAYQEGSDTKPAGYTLGEVETGKFIVGGASKSGSDQFSISESINVNDSGEITQNSAQTVSISISSSSLSSAKSLIGKFIQCTSHNESDFSPGVIWYIPSDAQITQDSRDSGGITVITYYVTKRQPVTGYAAIPAGTIIEYLGKLGDKARVQVVSYVGTGTYGRDNKNQLTFSGKPRFVMVPGEAFGYAYIPKGRFYYVIAGNYVTLEDLNCVWNDDTNTMTWYHSSYPYRQYNQSGTKYTFVAIY